MRFVIIGAGGHSREVADLVVACGHEISGFVDDAVTGAHRPTGLPVLDDVEQFDADALTIAVGDTVARACIYDSLVAWHSLPVLVDPSARVSVYADIGAGSQVMQNVVVNSTARVGVNTILNVGCIVAHDCVVGDHSHLALGAILSGGSAVGDRSLIGAGAVLLPGVRVGADCIVGAGAVVTHDVGDNTRVAGVPARPVREESR